MGGEHERYGVLGGFDKRSGSCHFAPGQFLPSNVMLIGGIFPPS